VTHARLAQVVAVRVGALAAGSGTDVPEFKRCTLAVHFMASRIVVPFVDCSADEQEAAHAAVAEFMHDTWPAQTTLEGVQQVRHVTELCASLAAHMLSLQRVPVW
jgi:hypothetical protein